MEKIAIIIPAYNEEKRIGKTLEEYGKFFINLKKEKLAESEIIVVINNTKDKTEEVVQKYKKVYPIITYLNFVQGGKGFAITEGFKYSIKKDFDLIGFVDADMSTSPEEFYKLIKNIGSYGGIIASRYIRGSNIKTKQPFSRIIVSRLGNVVIRALFSFNFRDTQCGGKIFRKNVIRKILQNLTITEWAFDICLLYYSKKYGFKIKEFPTVWEDRSESKLKLKKVSIQVLFAIARLRLINSKFALLSKPLRFLVRPIWLLVK